MKKRVRTFALCLILIVTGCALVFSQVGADKRPTPPPKISPPKTTTKRTSTRTTPSSTPRSTSKPAKPRQTAPQIEMVLIPAGTFMMGSPSGVGNDDQHPQHRVLVRQFYMGRYEVTQAQYRAVMGVNPSNFKGDYRPIESVSWNDAKKFCRKLSQMTGREYRLPSEAEWEYACRAGTTEDYAGDLDSMAWYAKNSGVEATHPVGQKQPNAWGLYDMHGNVDEWCEDWYHDNYNGAPTDGSAWESGEGLYRVLRGGSWIDSANGLRSAYRGRTTPDDRYLNLVGFRVVVAART